MYVMFPIGIMYYFGTNLDNRFAVPDFWPKAEHANKLPTEREEIHAELERLRARLLYLREKRLAEEAATAPPPVEQQQQAPVVEVPVPQQLQQPSIVEQTKQKGGWFW